jgi:hypothetical protein
MYYHANSRRNTIVARTVVIVSAALLAAIVGWNIAACGTTGRADDTAASFGTPNQTPSSPSPLPTDATGSGDAGEGGGVGGDGGEGNGVDGDGGQPPGPGPDPDGGDGGDGDGGGGEPPGPGPDEDDEDDAEELVLPSPKDCVSYNPANLTVKSAGTSGWLMVDGSHSMALFDTKADADDGVKVARNYRRFCFIGRDNDHSNRYAYIKTYFEMPSGLPLGLAPKLDCISYDPKNLSLVKLGGLGWRLVAGTKVLLLLDTQGDAERARLVASERSRLCFIGRGNDRPDPYRYTLEYWLG